MFKKLFVIALMAFGLSSYTYAQDDDEYEDEAPAKTTKKAKKSSKSSTESADGQLAIGMNLLDALDEKGGQKFYVTFALLPELELSAITSFYHHGETTGDNNNDEHGDNYTQIQLGVGADYFLTTLALPISVGGEFLFSHWGDDDNQMDINALAGTRVKLVGGFYVSAKLGISMNYIMDDTQGHDDTRFDFGLATRVQLHWFFL